MLDRNYLAKLFYVRYQNTVITLIASCSETNASAKVCCCNSFQDVFYYLIELYSYILLINLF
jgi:hypothetical protein